MNVSIKKFNVPLEVGSKGVEFEVRTPGNSDEFLGDMIVTKTGLTWCAGKTTAAKGNKKSWDEIIKFFSEE
jgi:hypothetical protein